MNDQSTPPGDRVGAQVRHAAERALATLRAQGLEHAQVSACVTTRHEINIAHNEPSLLRSTESPALQLVGIAGHRRASVELPDLKFGEPFEAGVAALRRAVESAPVDTANAVSSGQRAAITQGPQNADFAVLREAAQSLLDFRSRCADKIVVDECAISHRQRQWCTLTSSGSDLSGSLGWYDVQVFCVARDGKAVSSFDGVTGTADNLDGALSARFGIDDVLRNTQRQVRARPIGSAFTGSVVLAPAAVTDLLTWLLGQLGDAQLIARSSLYQDKVGQQVTSPLLTLKSRFDAPGVAAVSADAFTTPPVEVVTAGKLQCLLPSLYGSRKTGVRHVPKADGGWELVAGSNSKEDLVDGVARGALVGRLSMGRPASNGDFSGVIKNSFVVDNGQLGDALSETMIGGNVARMLRDIDAVSAERIDFGTTRLPWLRIPGLHFS